MRRLPSAVSLLAVAALLGLPASSGATITVGSSLAAPIDNSIGGDITAFPVAPAGALTTSPVNGMVVGGSVKQGVSGWGNVRLRAIHPLAGGMFQALASSVVNPVPTGTGVFPLSAQVPIAKGDIVAIQATGVLVDAHTLGATYNWKITSQLADNAPPTTLNSGFTDTELLYNARIEPTNSFTLGAPVIGKKGTATVVATVPNPGTLAAGSVSDTAVVAKKKKKKKGPLLTRIAATATDSGPVALAFQVSKAGRKKLREKGKLTAVAKVAYKPTGGAESTQTVVLKLKK
jgi:hypothetical protein